MSSPSFSALTNENASAKSFLSLPSAEMMSQEFDNICASKRHREQAMTSDQPSFGQLLEFRSGSLSSNEALRNLYADNSVVRLKRTARVLASLDNDDEKILATSDKLPSVSSPLVLAVGASQAKLQALPIMAAPARRRKLLPPAKTGMLPVSSPTELRALVEVTNSKRQEQIAHRKTHQKMLVASTCRKNQQAKSGLAFAWKSVKDVFAQQVQQLSNLLDQLALA
ncbi:MAG: hypothetical protein Q8T09_03930 [Candidatus Melainabacteria bacterium]|nr:hypothetical protein [Candidatus Melainabacteria bacterium]